MKRIAAALAGATLLILVASCGEEEIFEERLTGEAQTLLQQAQAAMQELDSYHATITGSGEGIVGSGQAIEYDWAAPDSFRSPTPIIRVEGIGACDLQGAGELRLSGCTEVRGETLEGYSEHVLVAGKSYYRWCQEKGSDCDEWEVQDAGPLTIMGVSHTQAHWIITALTMVREAEVAGEERIDGLPTVHLKGRLNSIQARVETWRRAAEDAGIDTVGEECVEEEATPIREGQTPVVIPTVQCRPVSVEEFLALTEDALEEQERSPAAVDVWIGRDDHLVRRFSASSAPDQAGDGERETVIDFSRFNEVTIQPPR